ncbi:hypothetical protein JJJ17_13965 [Paracoccus caeni]|uniref:Uncharacterized protein n=1 Tax=Paracoccus caeni TaxID=657651 RepID=A0A934W150_9RHOB|nr:hypothetical protein [Paracoccus caeni]MBK4217038.1 hypothetical protein [Paracoccus caeni]
MFIEVTRLSFNVPGQKVTVNVEHIIYLEQKGEGAEILLNNPYQHGSHLLAVIESYNEVQQRIGAAGAKFG